jgi:hypothetical protein
VGSVTLAAPGATVEGGPYSLILIDGAIEVAPAALVAALADDGRVVTGLIERGVARLAIGRKVAAKSRSPAWAKRISRRWPTMPRRRSGASERHDENGEDRAGRGSAWLRATLLGSAFGSALALPAAPALADDLREALVGAYNTNPTLQAARANQRATDAGVAAAKAPGLPSLAGTATYTEFVKNSPVSFTAPARVLVGEVNAGLPVYSGGSVRNSVHAAETRVLAGQASLRGTDRASSARPWPPIWT